MFFFLFFQRFYSVSCYVKQFLDGLDLFWEDIFFVFKESTLRYLEKLQVQIIVFNKKAAEKIAEDLQFKEPTMKPCVKFRSEFFFVNVSRIARWIFLVLIVKLFLERKVVLRNFAKLTGKHLCQRIFSIDSRAQGFNFIKKETLAQMFSTLFKNSEKR